MIVVHIEHVERESKKLIIRSDKREYWDVKCEYACRVYVPNTICIYDDNNKVEFIFSMLQNVWRCSFIAVYGQDWNADTGIYAFKPCTLLSYCFLHDISTSQSIGTKNVYLYAHMCITNRYYSIVNDRVNRFS